MIDPTAEKWAVAATRETKEKLDLSPVLDELIDWKFKSFPTLDDPIPIRGVRDMGWNALGGDFLFPVMVMKRRALQHNIALMARYCRSRHVSLAPHAKTPVSPQLAQLQLAAGAWALCVANVHQARVFRAVGASRLLLANEVVDGASASWIATELDRETALVLYCLVDSVAGVRILDGQLRAAGCRRRLSVLIELGIPGGRCGCRTAAEAVDLSAAVAASEYLELAGVETYENMFPSPTRYETADAVDRLLRSVRDLVVELDSRRAFDVRPEIIVTAGGSMWFDRVVTQLGEGWKLSRPVRTVIRSGSYLTHDAVEYERLSPLAGRAEPGEGRLRQVLELWGVVLSRPEENLAVLGFGKRDAAHDRGFPLPFAAHARDKQISLDPSEYSIASLNDQHARMSVPTSSPLQPGDLVGCFISHPCTSFDNWRLIPLVNEQYGVLDAIRCFL